MSEVTVTYYREADSWWADSDDLPGFTALARTFSETRALVTEYVGQLQEQHVRLVELLEDGARIICDDFQFRLLGSPSAYLLASAPVGSLAGTRSVAGLAPAAA